MCGRFALFAEESELVSLFDLDLLEGEAAGPRYNQAPGQDARVVFERLAAPGGTAGSGPAGPGARILRKGRFLRWGLVPSWAKTPSRPMINARAETALDKPSFRTATTRRRCIVPANGYFEWETEPGSTRKTPWFLSAGEGDPIMGFAGIYEAWRDPRTPFDGPGGGWLLSFAILTRAAPDGLGRIHERTPLVLPPGMWDDWLDPELVDPSGVHEMIAAVPEAALRPRIVSPRVGAVGNDDPTLIEEIPG